MLRLMLLLALLPVITVGCTPVDPGDGGDGEETIIVVDLGTTGMFSSIGPLGENAAGAFDITADLPADLPGGVQLFFESADISLGTAADINSLGLSMLVTLAPPDLADPCTSTLKSYEFSVTLGTNGATAIDPESVDLDTDGFALASTGQFGICLTVVADEDAPVTFSRLQLRFQPPGDVTVASCDEVLSLPEVQAAIAQAASNGFTFEFPTGDGASTNGADSSGLPNLQGDYELTQTVTFDPDGDNEGDEQSGAVTLDNQTSNGIRRQGFDASTTFFTAGDATSVGFCVVQRTNNPACDQTIARLEALVRDPATGDLDGHFLSVAVRRHRFTRPTCGPRGDYIYGDLTLNTSTNSFAALRGKVALSDPFVPSFVVLSPVGSNGTVSDRDSGTAIRFSTKSPFNVQTIGLPSQLNAEGFSALGISRDGSRLAVVTDLPDAGLIYDNTTLQLIRANASTSADYLGGLVDFDIEATRIFVPTTDTQFSDRITVLRAEVSTLPDIIREFVTPQGEIPVQVRLSPNGTRLAVLLEGDAPIGEAAKLTFGNPTTGGFQLPPIDLTDDAGGTALASEIVYSPDGNLVFLAGTGAVLAVQTASPYNITRIDVSDGNDDNPVALALSNDGKVLAVAIDDAAGPNDFAVIDTNTLNVLNAQDVPGVGARRALGLAHFGTERIAIVAGIESTVVAVQTEAPYAAGSPILVAPDGTRKSLGRIVAGGGVIAVTNIDEPAVYLLGVAATN
jgi:hypothetical protein